MTADQAGTVPSSPKGEDERRGRLKLLLVVAVALVDADGRVLIA